jgi:hypothetical protein
MPASRGANSGGPAGGGSAPPTATGPTSAPSAAPGSSHETTCILIERLLGLTATHKESDRGLYIDRGLYVIKQGSSYVMIAVLRSGPSGDQILVRVTAQVVAGVRAEAALLRQLLILNGRLRFGAFAYEPHGELIIFQHTLLGGGTLDDNEFRAAVHDVALVADRYDDHIVARYGGRRMQDVLEESAWARMLHLNERDGMPLLDDTEEVALRTAPPKSGPKDSGKKKS